MTHTTVQRSYIEIRDITMVIQQPRFIVPHRIAEARHIARNYGGSARICFYHG